jgi:hypothetical protein
MSSEASSSLIPPLSSTPTPLRPQERRIKGTLFRLVEHTANLYRTTTPSRVWEYGGEYERVNAPLARHVWICDKCNSVHTYPQNKSTSSMVKHLWSRHRINTKRQSRLPTDGRSTTTPLTEEALSSVEIDQEMRDASQEEDTSPLDGFQSLVVRVRPDKWRQRFIKWVVHDRVAFSAVKSQEFRDMLTALQPSIEEYIPKSPQTVANWVLSTFREAEETIKERLKTSRSKIHLSFDAWTSPSCKGYLGVIAHFLNPQYQLEHILIGFKEIEGRHTGQNIALILLNLIEEYEIAEMLGCFVADNATTNDAAVEETLRILDSDGDKNEVRNRRSRCLGHIINLAAKAFIFGQDIEGFEREEELDNLRLDHDLLRSQARWRAKGPIGKFHNIVVFARSSSSRKLEFRQHLKAVVSEAHEQGEITIIKMTLIAN